MIIAKAKTVASTEGTRAEFSRAGVPDEVVRKVLKQYPTYLRWPIDTKLRPALQLWTEQIGSQQLSGLLVRHASLLCCTPVEYNDVYLWLVSVGIDAESVQQRAPKVMSRQLNDIQSTVQFVQQALQLADQELAAFFFRQHVHSLQLSPECVQTFQTMAELLAMPVASQEMREVVLACDRNLFSHHPALMLERVSLFCKEFSGGQLAAKAALKQAAFFIPAETLREHANQLEAMLGLTEGELNKVVCVCTQKC